MFEVSLKRRQGVFRIDAAFERNMPGVTALFGPSGAGKTSIVNMIAGLLRPDSGRIILNGRRLFDSARNINLPPERRRIGYVFQESRLFPHLTVRSNLIYGMRRTAPSDRYVQFDQVVDLLGIGHLLARRPAQLSGGEKQRVAVGRALLSSPAMLLLDEPLASLDAARKAEVLPFIRRMCREFSLPIIYVSHAMDEILNLAGHLVLLDSGGVVAAGAMEDLLSRMDIQRFLGHTACGSAIPTTVAAEADAFGLTHLLSPGGVLKVPRIGAKRGEAVRIHISPGSVAVALEKPRHASFQNCLSGVIEGVTEEREGLVDVHMDIGCPLLASITQAAFSELRLKVGQSVYALFDSVAVSYGGGWETEGVRAGFPIRTGVRKPRPDGEGS
jgi:molybdate transport system ATP-binding protein